MIPHELPKLPQARMYLKSALWGFDDLLMKKLSGSPAATRANRPSYAAGDLPHHRAGEPVGSPLFLGRSQRAAIRVSRTVSLGKRASRPRRDYV